MASEFTSAPSGSSSQNKTTFHVGTRKSALALKQTDIAISFLKKVNPAHKFQVFSSESVADKDQNTALYKFNAKSLWTSELEAELVTGATDLIIHSLKDMPTQLPMGCALGAAINREEKRDCVVMSPKSRAAGFAKLADLPAGSVVGTSSVRRLSLLRRLFPHLETEDMRGNVGTRLGKLDVEGGKFSALILAATGLQRTGNGDRVSSFLSRKEGDWLGPVGQGAIGVEIRHDDEATKALCEGIMADGPDSPTGHGKRVLLECLAERNLLRTLEGGCSVPIGIETEWQGDELVAYTMVASVDGKEIVEGKLTRKVQNREEAESFGLDLAQEMVERGAGKILEEITLNRQILENSGNA